VPRPGNAAVIMSTADFTFIIESAWFPAPGAEGCA
jgi:hypothetical protein